MTSMVIIEQLYIVAGIERSRHEIEDLISVGLSEKIYPNYFIHAFPTR